MSKRKSDEEKREAYIERRRAAPPRRGTGKRRSENITTKKVSTREKKFEKNQRTTDSFYEKRELLRREVSNLAFKANNIPSKVNQVNDNISELTSRINSVKTGGYFIPKSLEEQSNELLNKWSQAEQDLANYGTRQSNLLLQKQANLESSILNTSSINELLQYENNLKNLARDLALVESTLNSNLNDYQDQFNQINKELLRAEDTQKNLMGTSIQWKNGEFPVYSTRIDDLTNNREGILTLSNLRIFFEAEKEEIIKKTLFFATEKRTIRDVIINQPIGAIETIEKARVGFLKGAGLYIKFKPQTGIDELKIDTRSDDDQDIVYYYNLIQTGQLEGNFQPEKGSSINMPTICPICSAPFTDEILRGQTSVRCNYCGSVIKL